MNRDEALARAKAGKHIESARELAFALNEVRCRCPEGSTVWYAMNSFSRSVMALADAEKQHPEHRWRLSNVAMPVRHKK